MKHSKPSHSFAWLLTLLAPGLGHVYWAEYLFGIFVFLIMLIGMVLLFFSYIVDLPFLVRLILFGLPLIFYLFVFLDLSRTIRKWSGGRRRTERTAVIFLVCALVGNVLFPLSPTNFLWRNGPEIIFSSDDDLTPFIAARSVGWVDRQAYSADIFFMDEPYFHAAPDRFELVRLKLEDGNQKSALLVGFPGEEVTMINDTLFVDGYPWTELPSGLSLSGRLPLTQVGSGSILAVTFKQGTIHRTFTVPLGNLTGRVHRLF